jgi:hypothetical protein
MKNNNVKTAMVTEENDLCIHGLLAWSDSCDSKGRPILVAGTVSTQRETGQQVFIEVASDVFNGKQVIVFRANHVWNVVVWNVPGDVNEWYCAHSCSNYTAAVDAYYRELDTIGHFVNDGVKPEVYNEVMEIRAQSAHRIAMLDLANAASFVLSGHDLNGMNLDEVPF